MSEVNIKFTPLYGANSDTLSYILRVNSFTFLLDCGWVDPYDTAILEPLVKAVGSIDAGKNTLLLSKYPSYNAPIHSHTISPLSPLLQYSFHIPIPATSVHCPTSSADSTWHRPSTPLEPSTKWDRCTCTAHTSLDILHQISQRSILMTSTWLSAESINSDFNKRSTYQAPAFLSRHSLQVTSSVALSGRYQPLARTLSTPLMSIIAESITSLRLRSTRSSADLPCL